MEISVGCLVVVLSVAVICYHGSAVPLYLTRVFVCVCSGSRVPVRAV